MRIVGEAQQLRVLRVLGKWEPRGDAAEKEKNEGRLSHCSLLLGRF